MNYREQFIKANFKYFGSISILYGILFAFCMYRNLFGAAFLIYAAATVGVLVLFLGKIEMKLKRAAAIYFTAVILCGISTCITGSKMLQWLNWCCIIGLLVLAMLSQFFDESRWNIASYVFNAAVLFFATIGYSFLPAAETKRYVQKGRTKKDRRIKLIFTGIAAALGTLVIILPLLISSDMIFRDLFERFAGVFRMEKILPNLWAVCQIVLTAFAGFALIYAFFYASCHAAFPAERERMIPRCHAMTGISFTAVIGGIYTLYCGVQMVYLFFGNEGKLPPGITYSEYARAGFWQLAAVAFLNIVMVLTCMYLFEENKILKGLLALICGLTFIMTASAAYRMYLYVGAYHLTFLRVLVLWALLILTFIMGGVVAGIYRKRFPLVRYMIMTVICGYLVFSFARPDYMIAKYNVGHMERIGEDDLDYMLYGLSLDAAPVISQIEVNDTYAGDDRQLQGIVKGQLYEYFRTISENNEGIYLRKANYSRIRAKQTADEYLEQHREDEAYDRYYYSEY